MLLHLPATERARPAASLPALQRGGAAVPPLVPSAHHLLSTSHTVAPSECGEGMSGGVGTVLEKDAVLGSWTELLHGEECSAAEEEGGGSVVGSVHVGISKISCSLLAQQEKKQKFGRDTMYE